MIDIIENKIIIVDCKVDLNFFFSFYIEVQHHMAYHASLVKFGIFEKLSMLRYLNRPI